MEDWTENGFPGCSGNATSTVDSYVEDLPSWGRRDGKEAPALAAAARALVG